MNIIRVLLITMLAFGGVGLAQYTSSSTAEAASCIADCRARYSKCLIQTRDRQRCLAELQRCGDGCINGRRRLGGPLKRLMNPWNEPPVQNGHGAQIILDDSGNTYLRPVTGQVPSQ